LVANFGAEIATAFCVSTVSIVALLCLIPCTALAVTAISGVAKCALLPSSAPIMVLTIRGVSVLLVRCTVLATGCIAVSLALCKSCAGSQKCDSDQSFHGCSGLLMGE